MLSGDVFEIQRKFRVICCPELLKPCHGEVSTEVKAARRFPDGRRELRVRHFTFHASFNSIADVYTKRDTTVTHSTSTEVTQRISSSPLSNTKSALRSCSYRVKDRDYKSFLFRNYYY